MILKESMLRPGTRLATVAWYFRRDSCPFMHISQGDLEER